MIFARIIGTEALRRNLLRLVPDLAREATAETAQQVFDNAREAASAHTKTGALVRSLKVKKLPGGDRYEVAHDLQVAPHALFVHWGTRPHDIRPRNKKTLRWVGHNGFVFAQLVHHPGYKGDPYLTRARDAVARRFSTIAREAWANITRRFAGS